MSTLVLEGRFKSMQFDEDCQQLYAFLHEPETMARMDCCVRLGRPPLEGLVHLLEGKFGHRLQESQGQDRAKVDEFKRVCGHLVRKVLEESGLYSYVKPGVKVKTGVFSTASLFALKH